MADNIHLRVISAEGVVMDQMVNYLSIPGADGSVGVMAGHLPMLCAVKEGVAKCRFEPGETALISVKDGVAHVLHNEVTFLVSSAKVIR